MYTDDKMNTVDKLAKNTSSGGKLSGVNINKSKATVLGYLCIGLGLCIPYVRTSGFATCDVVVLLLNLLRRRLRKFVNNTIKRAQPAATVKQRPCVILLSKLILGFALHLPTK